MFLVALMILVSFACTLLVHFIAQSESGLFNIEIFYIQIALLLSGSGRQWLDWLAIFSFNVPSMLGATCVAPLTPEEKLTLQLLTPFLLTFELMLIQLLSRSLRCCNWRRLLLCCNRNNGSGSDVSSSWAAGLNGQSYRRSYITMFLFTYSSIAETVLLTLNCIDIGPYYVIQSIPAISCTSEYYTTLKPIITAWLIIAVILVPVLMILYLLYHRHHIVDVVAISSDDNHHDHASASDAPLSVPLIPSLVNSPPPARPMERWLVLYETFDTTHWCTMIWSIVLLGRRAILVALLQLPLGPFRSSMLALFSSIALIIHIIARPYRRQIANHLESIALTCHLFLSISTTSQQLPYSFWLKLVIFILVTVPTLLLFMLIGIIEYRRWRWRSNKQQVKVPGNNHDRYNNNINYISLSPLSPTLNGPL